MPVLKAVLQDDHATESLSFDDGSVEINMVLGLQCDSSSMMALNVLYKSNHRCRWKAILLCIAHTLDPMDLLTSVIFYVKHEIWKVNLAWDEPLSLNFCQSWKMFIDKLTVSLLLGYSLAWHVKCRRVC